MIESQPANHWNTLCLWPGCRVNGGHQAGTPACHSLGTSPMPSRPWGVGDSATSPSGGRSIGLGCLELFCKACWGVREGLREAFWAFWTTHVPSPGPGAGYGQRSPSQNRPFPSPNPHGEQRPHPPNPPDPEQTVTAPTGLPHQDWWPQLPASWTEGPMWHSGLQAEASIHGATWMRRLPSRPGLPSLQRALVFGGALDGAGPGDSAQGRAPAGQCCLQWASRTGPTDPSSSISIPLWGRNVGGGCSGASCPRPHARLGCR